MARRRYYYRRVVRPKQKWAINNVDVRISSGQEQVQLEGGNNAIFYQYVVQNGYRVSDTQAAQSVVSSAQILKCGRFKFKGCIPVPTIATSSSSSSFSLTVFIAYVPEGFQVAQGAVNDQNIFYRHPEWIIGWTRKDYVSISQSNEISITSRLKRNLNTGDQIIVACMLNNSQSEAITVGGRALLQGVLSYCCRAN